MEVGILDAIFKMPYDDNKLKGKEKYVTQSAFAKVMGLKKQLSFWT